MTPERRAELVKRIKPLCDPFEVFTAEDGHPAIRGKPPEKLAHQVIDTLAPELTERGCCADALRRYGRHLRTCLKWNDAGAEWCDCGFQNVLDAIGGDRG